MQFGSGSGPSPPGERRSRVPSGAAFIQTERLHLRQTAIIQKSTLVRLLPNGSESIEKLQLEKETKKGPHPRKCGKDGKMFTTLSGQEENRHLQRSDVNAHNASRNLRRMPLALRCARPRAERRYSSRTPASRGERAPARAERAA